MVEAPEVLRQPQRPATSHPARPSPQPQPQPQQPQPGPADAGRARAGAGTGAGAARASDQYERVLTQVWWGNGRRDAGYDQQSIVDKLFVRHGLARMVPRA